MAPVTRRRSKAAQEDANKITDYPIAVSSDAIAPSSDAAGPDEASILEVQIPAKKRSKRKSTSSAAEAESAGDVDHETPKRQKLAVRTREEDDPEKGQRRMTIEVQLPSKKTKRDRSDSVADSQDSGDDEADIEPTPQSASKQLEEEASQKLSQDLAASQSTAGKPKSAPTPTPKAAPKGKHVVFGNDDDVENFVAAAAESSKKLDANKEADAESNEDDSDDDAPEAVSTQTAAKQTQKSELAVQQAADKQAATLKRKRQERDLLFKNQAAKRKQVHKPRNHKKSKAVARDAEDSDSDQAPAERATTSGRRRADRVQLPGFLPAEFLTDSESDDEEASALRMVKKPKKITFESAMEGLSKEGKRPRDQVVGEAVYRVLAEQGDPILAPKMRKNSRQVKESLLKRRRSAVVPTKGPAGKGFFRRK